MTEQTIIAIASLIALVIAITTHEASHGYVAKLFGDRTAEMMGRLTFNPIKHVDLFGTIILPGLLYLTGSPFLFGYAKPVPVAFENLRPRRAGEFFVAFAGPGVNFLLAFLSALLLHYNPTGETFGNDILVMSIRINIMLGVFNLFPILPLDGGRMLNAILPRSLAQSFSRTERYGFLVLLLMLVIPMGGGNLLSYILLPFVKIVMTFILKLAGLMG